MMREEKPQDETGREGAAEASSAPGRDYPKRRRSLLRRGLRWVVWTTVCLLLGLALALASVQTGTGRRILVSWVEGAVRSATGSPVRIGPMHGLVPVDVRIESMELGDAADPWLRIRGIALQWSPESLLKGRLRIGLVEADGVEILGLPPQRSIAPNGDEAPLSWPPSLPPVLLDRFAAKRVFVDRRVLGQEAAFSVSARMALAGDGTTVQGECDLRRIDDPAERLRAAFTLETAPPHLDLDLRLDQPGHGILLRLAGLNAGAVRLRLFGKGPPGAWEGKLSGESGAWGGIRTDLRVRAGADRVDVRAQGELAPKKTLLGPELAAFMDPEGCRLSLNAGYSAKGLLTVDRLDLSTEQGKVSLDGRYDTAGARGEARADLSLPRLGALGPHVPGVLGGALHARIHIRKDAAGPEADADLEVTDLQAHGAKAGRAAGRFRFRPAAGTAFPFLEGLRMSGEGVFHDLAARAGERMVLLPKVGWSGEAALPSPNALSIRALRVTDGNVTLTAEGQAGLEDRSVGGEVRLAIADLSRALFLNDLGLKGRADISATVRGEAGERALRARVEGVLEGIGPLPRGLGPMVGEGPRFEGHVALLDGRSVEVTDLKIRLAGGEVSGYGRADLIDRNGNAAIQAEVPDAALLSAAAGRPLKGSAVLRGEIQGDFDAPSANGVLTVRGLEVDRFRAREVRVTARAEDLLESPEAEVEMEMLHRSGELHGRAGAALDGGALRLRDLSFEGPGFRMDGRLDVNTETLLAEGDLNAVISDLAPLSGLWGERLGGSGTLSASLSGRGRAQDVRLRVRLRDLRGTAANARNLELRADARDLFGEPAGMVDWELTAMEAGELQVEALAFKASGGADRVKVQVAGRGRFREPFHGSAQGTVQWPSQEGIALEVESLDGAFGPHPVRLERPCRVRLSRAGELETDPFLLHVGDGRVDVEGRLGEPLALKAGFQDLPLTLLRAAGLPDMTGSASGSLSLQGTRREPSAALTMKVEAFGIEDPSLASLPLLDLSARASLDSGRLQGTGVVAGLGERPLEISLAVPAAISLSPLSVGLVRDGPLDGRIEGGLALDPLPAWLSLPDHLITGRLEADAAIGGTVASPDVRGGIRVRGGTWESLRTGTVVRDLDLDLRVSGRTVTLEHARGTDGADGRLDVEGRLRILPDQGFPFTARVAMDRFRLIRLDEVNVATGGDLAVSGSTESAQISGKVQVTSAQIRIPDRMPARIQELDVVEVNVPAPSHPKPEAAPASRVPGIDLDLEVEVPARAFVRGRGLDSEWKGDLVVTGDTTRPEVRGTLDIVRGHYNAFGKRFSLVSGSVLFDGAYPPRPYMQVIAEHPATEMTAQVQLTGTPDSLDLRISSDPPLPQDEVLARLLFDRSLTSITPFQALRLARAMDELRGGKTFGFVDRAQEAVGVDQVEIRQDEEEKGPGSLSVGKYVGDNVYMEVEKGISSEEGKVSLEVEVTPRITVETEVGTDAGGGVEVKWKWDY